VSKDLAFLACLERGKLEDQTVLLCRSIRKFGGAYSRAPIYLFQPRPGMEPSQRTLASLGGLGAVLIRKPLNLEYSDHGTLNKVFVCAYAERILDESILVFLDSDTVVVAEPTELDLPPSTDLALRPADSTHLNSRGLGDPIDMYWRRVLPGNTLEQVPFIITELGRRVRAYFSAGLIAVRREAAIFREWEGDLRRLISDRIVPAGALGRMDEIALVAIVVRRLARLRLLDMRYNYLIYRRSIMIPPLRGLLLNELVHIHYRFAFYKPGFLRSVQPSLGGEGAVSRWLEQHLPLEPTIDDAEDVSEVCM
jgi:hypothetical protein